MTPKLPAALARLSHMPQVLGLVWAASKGWTAAWAILLVVQGVLPAGIVFLSRLLIDGLVDAIGTGLSWESAQPVVVLAVMMAGILLMIELSSAAMEWVRTAQSEFVRDHVSALVHEQAVAVDLAFYESSEFHDRLERAHSDANDRSLALLESGGSVLQNGITLLAMAFLIVPYGAWLPPVLMLSTLPALYVVVRHSQRQHRWWESTTPDRRWTQYYDTMLTHSSAAPEVRLFGLGSHFMGAYQTIRRRLRDERLSLVRRQSLARLFAGFAVLLISGAAMAWMVWRALIGVVTLGDLVLFYQAFTRGQNLARSLLSSVGQVYSNSLFLGNLFEYLRLKPLVRDRARPIPVPSSLVKGISFNRVTFSYPGTERPAIEDFDLTLPAGRTVAIVGPNGAGKSTLVKLLCRFYDPGAGSIELDGIDIRELSTAALRSQMSVLFQFPVRYHATAAQNIAVGDIESNLGGAAVEEAARNAGVHETISRLPRGYETILGRWFAGGIELSGGEWQRVALARAFVRQAPIIVLDEPTSFMDSWAELDWLDRFRTLATGRTTLVITHRFTTAMRADEIHVMNNGQIVESGTHDELLARGGLYAQSWEAQTQAGAETLRSPSSSHPIYTHKTFSKVVSPPSGQ